MAEGFSRFTFADKANKYVIARGECSEVEAFLFMIVALKYVQDSEIHRALEYVEVERKLISGMISSCRKRQI